MLGQHIELTDNLRQLAVAGSVESEFDIAVAGLFRLHDMPVISAERGVVLFECVEREDDVFRRHGLAVMPARIGAQSISNPGVVVGGAHGFSQQAVLGRNLIIGLRHQRFVDQIDAEGEVGGEQPALPEFHREADHVAGRDRVEAEIVEHVNLNSSRSDKETVHLALAFENGAPAYKPGDSLDLYPENDPAYVDDLLKAAGLTGDDALRIELIKSRDVTTLSAKTVETYAASTGHTYVNKLIADGEVRDWIADRQLIDLLATFPIALDADRLRALTRPLAPRAYSIASSRSEVGDEAHLLISAVRYETHGRARKGVASNFVAERLKKGGRVRVKLKPNKHFGLPAADKDIIMIGPGTGVAPFRAFVQERRAAQATGKSWLFFGDRTFTHDFLYQLDWQEALKDGALTRMDVAFSRDRPQKIYVQDKIWERRRDLVDWLDNGAHFYVCGDAKSMAKDVRAMLVKAYADVKACPAEAAEQAVATLEREKRYLQDVY
jgi:sulfite reductase (NADPH) flavoprotein alpha-component